MLVNAFHSNRRNKFTLFAYLSAHIKLKCISISIFLFILIFQVHYIRTEYLHRFYFWNHQVVNAMESLLRMQFVKGLVAIKGRSSVSNVKPDAQVHALTTFALTSFSRHNYAEVLED